MGENRKSINILIHVREFNVNSHKIAVFRGQKWSKKTTVYNTVKYKIKIPFQLDREKTNYLKILSIHLQEGEFS